MDVQTIFYTMGIIFMSIMFIFMIALIVLLFYIKSRLTMLERNIREKVEFASNVGELGGKAVGVAVDKLKEFIESKNRVEKKKK